MVVVQLYLNKVNAENALQTDSEIFLVNMLQNCLDPDEILSFLFK